jgi:hypothetical protein
VYSADWEVVTTEAFIFTRSDSTEVMSPPREAMATCENSAQIAAAASFADLEPVAALSAVGAGFAPRFARCFMRRIILLF